MSTIRRQPLLVHLEDGRTLTADALNPDFIRWELTAARERWPIVEVHGEEATVKAPILMNTYLAWAALKRTGQYDGGWPEFSEKDCLGVEAGGLEDVDPTPPEPGSGS